MATFTRKMVDAMKSLEVSEETLCDKLTKKVQEYISTRPPPLGEIPEDEEAEDDTEEEEKEHDPEVQSNRTKSSSKRSEKIHGRWKGKAPSQGSQKWTPEEWDAWKRGQWGKTPVTPVRAISRRRRLEELLFSIGQKVGVSEDFTSLCTLLEDFQDGIFPTQFLGWLLLQRSGLGPQERSVILSQSKGLELNAVEEALKRQWDDTELKEHDGSALATLPVKKYSCVAIHCTGEANW